MIQLTVRDIIAHQSRVPWPDRRQVEQDLLLCHGMAALFNEDFLKTQVAMQEDRAMRAAKQEAREL